MQDFPASQSPLPAAWTEVLDKVDETLRRTAETAAEREQALLDLLDSSDDEAERVARWQESLNRLQQQLPGWSAALGQAENEATEADAVLKEAQEALHGWLTEADSLEQRLAKWLKPEV